MDVIVSTTSGTVRGRADGGVARFLGIPYAAPPFGVRRLCPPQPPEPWAGERDALVFGPTAPQPPYPPTLEPLTRGEPVIPGEDILNLNVWTPSPGRTDGGLPVLVVLHGGSLRNGSGAVPVYDGSAFARDGVVCVTLNYRLGAEGFIHLPDVPANLGLLDQIAALEWVRDNIAAFGGDPARVTLLGWSAGAFSAAALMVMDRAAGLFRGVIAQSGNGHFALPGPIAERISERIAVHAGVRPTREGFTSATPSLLAKAADAVQQELALATDPEEWGEAVGGLAVFLPVVDEELLPRMPTEAMAAGAGAEYALLAGTTSDEARYFLVTAGLTDNLPEEALPTLLASRGLPDPARAVAHYRGGWPDATAGDVLAAVLTDAGMRIPAVRMAEARQTHGADTYLYEFGWHSRGLDGRLRACHSAELGFVFDNLSTVRDVHGDTAPQTLADRMHAAWVAFVRDGRPGPVAEAGDWPPYGTDRAVLRFGTTSRLDHDPAAAGRLLWEGIR